MTDPYYILLVSYKQLRVRITIMQMIIT